MGLTWHNGAIPNQQLWVKIGGDKGHGSFKLNLQLCNVENPNSRQNTCLVSVFMAHDTRANLWTALRPYSEQLIELEGMNLGSVILTNTLQLIFIAYYIHREREISVFLSGDYEFLCKVYGLSGASG